MPENRTTGVTRSDLLAGMPAAVPVGAAEVRQARGADPRRLVVLDDDPTGTQSVADLPVLTGWSEDDLAWALGTGAPAVYVMTNSRSLDPDTAERRNRDVVETAVRAAERCHVEIDVVSRSDSTLRGHFPLETDAIAATLAAADDRTVDGVILAPAFADAGRLTVRSVHYAGSDADGFVPVGRTEFARDATFGYTSSDLRAWVAEKTDGRVPPEEVVPLTLDRLRAGPGSVAEVLNSLRDARPVAVDIAEENDLRLLALGILRAEADGRRFVHRVGPPFVRALIGQDVADPLTPADVAALHAGAGREDLAPHGLVVVGSHVALTTRQLDTLRERRRPTEIEIDVARVLGQARDAHLEDVMTRTVEGLRAGTVVLSTSRTLVTGQSGDDSLDIARRVSDAVVSLVRRVIDRRPPRFVVAKGGITSSDVAAHGLEISRAFVRGPMLPGIVSLWEPVGGPAHGIPYVVFAGNVGDEHSLADVVDKLTARG